MRIKATDFNGKDVRVIIEAENEAELYQLHAIKVQFDKAGAHWHEWDDMEGSRGITLVAAKRPNAEVRGDAPLYGAASLSTDGLGNGG